METLEIRLMQEADLPTVVEIEQISFTTPWSKTLFFNEIYKQHSIAKVAATGKKIIGYICSNQIVDEGHILDLAVHPDSRRKGVAKSLVENILKEFRENSCRFIYLEVRASNASAVTLYTSIGFDVIGRRKEYYDKPREDAVMMRLVLT